MSKKNEITYLIEIKTGDVKNIGSVFLSIYGTKSQIEKTLLKENKLKKLAFEKNKADEFEIKDIDVGEIKQINIGHDGKGYWNLENVAISKSGKSYKFVANRALDPKSGDKKTFIELVPTDNKKARKEQPAKEQKESKENNANANGTQKAQKEPRDASKPKNAIKYIVTLKTGDKTRGANANSSVIMSMYGTKGTLESVKLHSKLTDKVKGLFEHGVDEFKFDEKDIGKIQKIKIGHDLANLHLEYISIKTPYEIKTWTVNKTLEKASSIELKSDQQQQQQQQQQQKESKQQNQQNQKPQQQQQKQQQQQTNKQEKSPPAESKKDPTKQDVAGQKNQKLDNSKSSSNSKNAPVDTKQNNKDMNKEAPKGDENKKMSQSQPEKSTATSKKSRSVERPNEDEDKNKEKKESIISLNNSKVGSNSLNEANSTKVQNKTDEMLTPSKYDKSSQTETISNKTKNNDNNTRNTSENKEAEIADDNKRQANNEKITKSNAESNPKLLKLVKHNRRRSKNSNKIRKSYEPKPPKHTEEAIKIELRKLKNDLDKEVNKIKFSKRQDYHPYVFNDLQPYYNVHQLENLINSPERMPPVGYYNRYTATGIVDPWIAYRMEHSTAPLSSRSQSQSIATSRAHVEASGKPSNDRPSKDQITGSTLAPNYPKVIVKKPKDLNGPFYFSDVKAIREEVKKNLNNKSRFEEDRNRTINDYYRMNLDQTVDNEIMMKAYEAYLSNTPGSKKALGELLNKNTNRETTANNKNEDNEDKYKERKPEQHENENSKIRHDQHTNNSNAAPLVKVN